MHLPPPHQHRVLTVVAAVALLSSAGCSDGSSSADPLPPAAVTASATESPADSAPTATTPTTAGSPTSTSPTPTATPTPTPTAPPTTEAPEDPLAPRPPLETAPPTGQPVCSSKDLTVVDADAIISKTSVQELFVVRTTGPDCQLSGYPTVELRDAKGAVLAATYRPGGFGLPVERPTVHTLSAGTSVSFVVASGRTGSCSEAATARVRLPGTSGGLTTTTAFAVCDKAVGLSPIRRQLDIE